MINEAKRNVQEMCTSSYIDATIPTMGNANGGGGFTCGCGAWVPYGTSHVCFQQPVLPRNDFQYYWTQPVIDLSPLVEEVRKIREVFERMEQYEKERV